MKTIITIISLAVGTTLLHAQGLIEIAGRPLLGGGNPAAGVFTNTSSFYAQQAPGTPGFASGPTFSQSTAGVAYYYALLIASSTTAGDLSPLGPDWSQAMVYNSSPLSAITATNFPTVVGSVIGTGGVGGVAVSGWVQGNNMNIMLVGWSANLGTSWTIIAAQLSGDNWIGPGYFGYSGIGNIQSGGAGDPPSPPTSIFSTGGILGFDLYSTSVPEPTTLALAGLGGLSMLLFRRRKA